MKYISMIFRIFLWILCRQFLVESLDSCSIREFTCRRSANCRLFLGKKEIGIFPGEESFDFSTDVVVVGAGIGGLSIAARLASLGAAVAVLEKNSESDVGGRMNGCRSKDGVHRFDVGPSILLLPEIYRETFQDIGCNIDDICQLKRVSPTYTVYFSDGTEFIFGDDRENLKEQFEKLEAGSFEAFETYMRYAELNFKVGWPNFIQEKFQPEGMMKFILSCLMDSPFESHNSHLRRHFKNPKIQALLSFQDLYVGLSPYTAPAVFSLLQPIAVHHSYTIHMNGKIKQAIELSKGIFYPVGGFHNIAKNLYARCKELGVKFLFDEEVKRVAVEENFFGNKATGVHTSKSGYVHADSVVLNCDLPFAEFNLIPKPFSREILSKAEYSTGVIAFHWACNRKWDQLSHHTLFLSNDFEGSWKRLFSNNDLESDFNFYCAAASRTDPSVCPPDHDVVMALVPCPCLPASSIRSSVEKIRHAEDKEKMARWIDTAKKYVIEQFEKSAGMKGFLESIVEEVVYDPQTWRDTFNLERGAAFGLAHGLKQLSLLRPGQQHPQVKNLYFVGASTKPGNGVPLVMTGAKLLANRMQKSQPQLFRR